MNIILLDKKMFEMKKILFSSSNNFDEQIFNKFCNAIKNLKDWDTFRINPVDFADKTGIDRFTAMDMFVYGTKTGIFYFEWNLLCPNCGGREHSHETLDQIEKDNYHCTICDIDVAVEADTHMEVSFTVVREISDFTPDPFSSFDNYMRYYFSKHFVRPEKYAEVLMAQPKMRFVSIDSGQKCIIKINDTPAKKHRILSLETHSVYTAYFNQSTCAETRRIQIIHEDLGFNKKSETIDCGPAEIKVTNRSGKRIGIIAAAPDSEKIAEAVSKYHPFFTDFVTGKMVLNNQSFRELFLVDNLPNDLSLRINDITLMFTDLKGSTEMYGRTGDVRAYRLVQKHFTILQEMVKNNLGAIVKTMGDAIMASFCSPSDAVLAASEMIEEIKSFNKTISESGNTIGLKIGIHRGPVIAVKANQTLDYFGQTVNIAARVQALAGSGEIFLTKEVIGENNVEETIKSKGLSIEESIAELKGVSEKMTVYKCV